MKFLISIVALMVFSNQCGQRNDTTNTDSPSTSAQEELAIIYEAQSRGFYEKLWVDQSSISFADNRDLSNVKTRPISKADWGELVALKNALNLKTLPNLKAPSEKRFSDGAAIGSLTIKTKQAEVESSEFDHGNPPKELKSLLNKLLSIKEKL
ncbi:hypothetical protein [Gelidibacter salicanalis]|uniref:Uncharacterized protein n=1 Tax=Gelidibacter salicanalis TaxID=291193 RepID=A0A934KNX7_9FLAO|nr:hypothetical protein [Gelidibacter salicanalis]MBJ7879455.1 hypothetical protein [Gelidibacter salicanalis]